MPADLLPVTRGACTDLLQHRGVPGAQHPGLLRRTGGSRPWRLASQRDARPWMRFCMRAQFLQIRTTQRRRAEIEELSNARRALAERHRLERCAAALVDTAYGLRIRGSLPTAVADMTGEEISEQSASRNLKTMVDLAVLTPVGERRARYYLAGDKTRALRKAIGAKREPTSETTRSGSRASSASSA